MATLMQGSRKLFVLSRLTPAKLYLIASLTLLTACATTTPELSLPAHAERERIQQLQTSIQALDASIAPAEAKRAARIAIRHSHHLAQQYEITDSPLLHNLKVNLGIKQRGLCVDWTSDLLARLQQENFQSLDLHWAVANYTEAFRLEHSTVVISARGDAIENGLVLDPWRQAGRLHWAPVLEDGDYRWEPKNEILALKHQRRANQHDRQWPR